MDADNLYEKSPEAQQLLQRIPARLRTLAIVLFLGLAAGIWLLVNRLAFPESMQVDTYLQYEGQQQGAWVFTSSDPVPAKWLKRPRQTDIRIFGRDGGAWSVRGTAVFRAPDTVLVAGVGGDALRTIRQWPLRATLDIQLDTLPLWKKMTGYGRREQPG